MSDMQDDDRTQMAEITVREAPPRACLVCENTDVLHGTTGAEIRLVYGEVSIGRGSGNDAIVNADGVSKSHARMMPSSAGWIVEDLKSSNPVLVNDAQVPGPYLLDANDVLTIGVVRYRYELRPEEEPAEPRQADADDEPQAEDRTRTVYLSRSKAAAMQPAAPAAPAPATPAPAAAPPPQPTAARGGAGKWILIGVVVFAAAAVISYLVLR